MSTRLVSFLPTREVIHLSTTCDCPPIPTRNFDWSAIDSNTYDADYDYESGRFVSSSPNGRGATEAEAIEDLFDQLEAIGNEAMCPHCGPQECVWNCGLLHCTRCHAEFEAAA